MSAMPIAAIVALSVLVLALGGEWQARRIFQTLVLTLLTVLVASLCSSFAPVSRNWFSRVYWESAHAHQG